MMIRSEKSQLREETSLTRPIKALGAGKEILGET